MGIWLRIWLLRMAWLCMRHGKMCLLGMAGMRTHGASSGGLRWQAEWGERGVHRLVLVLRKELLRVCSKRVGRRGRCCSSAAVVLLAGHGAASMEVHTHSIQQCVGVRRAQRAKGWHG